MKRVAFIAAGAAVAALAFAAPASAEVSWLCRPGVADNPCDLPLTTTVFNEDGSSRVENPAIPLHPAIDCFYVYPTVSGQPTTNADKRKDPELYAIARYQAARYRRHCRVFAPVYRQLTLASIAVGDVQARAEGAKMAFADVREAWREYLANDNRGRPFVLIGHSQGTRMLRQLIREEIDQNAAVRGRLLSAILLGGNVLVRKGQRSGGDFQHVPACDGPRQTGCAIAFSTFNVAPPEDSRFGRPPESDTSGAGFPAGPDYEVLCTNPGSLGANARVPFTSISRTEFFPGLLGALIAVMYEGAPPYAPTPWVIPDERYTGRCERVAEANVLMLEPIGDARTLRPSPDDTWGLHLVDANIALGELVGVVGTQAQAFAARQKARAKRLRMRKLRAARRVRAAAPRPRS